MAALPAAYVAYAAIAATVVATAVTAYGQVQAGNAAKAQGDYQAAIDERNAEMARQDRLRDIQTAELAAEDKRREDRRTLASIRAAYGSSGLEMSGTPLDILSDVSQDMALDQRRISDEGQVKGREGTARIYGFKESATASRMAGSQAQKAGRISAAGTFFSGTSRALSMGAGGAE